MVLKTNKAIMWLITTCGKYNKKDDEYVEGRGQQMKAIK